MRTPNSAKALPCAPEPDGAGVFRFRLRLGRFLARDHVGVLDGEARDASRQAPAPRLRVAGPVHGVRVARGRGRRRVRGGDAPPRRLRRRRTRASGGVGAEPHRGGGSAPSARVRSAGPPARAQWRARPAASAAPTRRAARRPRRAWAAARASARRAARAAARRGRGGGGEHDGRATRRAELGAGHELRAARRTEAPGAAARVGRPRALWGLARRCATGLSILRRGCGMKSPPPPPLALLELQPISDCPESARPPPRATKDGAAQSTRKIFCRRGGASIQVVIEFQELSLA